MCNKSYLEDKYREKRCYIQDLFYITQDYDLSLKETKEFYILIKNELASDYNFHFTHMMFSKIYNNLAYKYHDMKLKNEAIKHAKISKKYLDKYNNIDTLVVENIWQFAMCYKDIDNDKSLHYFDMCYEFCLSEKNLPKKGLELHMAGVLDEIAVLTNEVEAIKTAISIISSLDNISQAYKQNNLDTMHEHMFEIYINNNSITNAMETIHNIYDINKAKQLKLKMIKLA